MKDVAFHAFLDHQVGLMLFDDQLELLEIGGVVDDTRSLKMIGNPDLEVILGQE